MGIINFGNRDSDDQLASIQAIMGGSTTNSALTFSTEATGGVLAEAMRIDSDGNVGIGTDAPAHMLDVQGEIGVGGDYIVNEQGRSNHIANTMSSPYYQLDGTITNTINCGNDDSIKVGSGDFSGFAWIKRIGTDGDDTIMGMGKGVGEARWYFTIAANKLQVYAINDAGNSAELNSTATITDENWHHVGFTYDRDSVTGLKFYIDGVLDSSNNGSNPSQNGGNLSESDPEGLTIGIRHSGGILNSAPFNGSIAGIQLYNKELSATEIKELYSGASVPFEYKGASQTELYQRVNALGDLGGNEADATTSLVENGSLDTFDSVTTDPSSGTWHIHAEGTGVHDGFRSIEIDTTIGKSYKCSFDIKVISGTVTMLGADTSAFNNDIYWSTTSTDAAWTRYTYEFTASAIYAYFQFKGIAEYYVDNVSIVRIGAVAEYDGSSAGQGQWKDKSGSANHGTVSGASLENQPAYQPVGQNLLTNSGFDVWSNSTSTYEGGELFEDPSFEDDSLWTIDQGSGGGTLTIDDGGSGNAVAVNAQDARITTLNDPLVKGRLYQFLVEISVWGNGNFRFYDDSGEMPYARFTPDGTGSFGTTFEATIDGQLRVLTDDDANWTATSMSLNEISVGCVGADDKAMDGWVKENNGDIDIYREPNGSNTKDGSFYSLKMVASAATYVQYPSTAKRGELEWVSRFAGRTATLGAWVKCGVAGQATVSIYDSGAQHNSSANVGTDWEWLEVTRNVPSDIVEFQVNIVQQLFSPNTMYVSQPMLVLGDYIGEGNYSRPVGEVIFFEQHKNSTTYGPVDGLTGNTEVNVETDTAGIIGKGMQALYMELRGSSATPEQTLTARPFSGTNNHGATVISQVDSITNNSTAWVPCSDDGNFELNAVGTWNEVTVKYSGVKLK